MAVMPAMAESRQLQLDEKEGEFLMLARNGRVDEIKELQSQHGDIDINCKGKAKSNRGWTALHLASYFGHLGVVEYLLASKADPDVRNFAGDTSLHKAAFTSREDVVHSLLQSDASVFVKNDERKKPADVACNPEIQEVLMAAEMVQTKRLRDRLFTAAKEGDVDGVVVALTAHPEIVNANTKDDLGNTALHYAAMRNRQSVAVYLLRHGGDSAIANNEGQTAVEMCRTMQLKRLLDVEPIQNSMRNVQRFEGFLYKRRFMRHRLHWVVLDKGVLSYFARHADAVTGTKRRMFKYLTDAAIMVREDNSHSFQIQFFDESIHYLQVKKRPDSKISRQKWVQAMQLHINYSSHYAKVGKVNESDSEEGEEDVMQMVNIQNTVETGFAHHELLKKQVDEFAVAVHKFAPSDTSQAAQALLGKCHQILSISNEMTLAFTGCLNTLQQQDRVRKIQLSQEKEQTRVWQQAFEALANEHHHLERTLSHHSRASLEEMSVTPDENRFQVNGCDRRSSAMSSTDGLLSGEEEFYDAFESDDEADFMSSPRETRGNLCNQATSSELLDNATLTDNAQEESGIINGSAQMDAQENVERTDRTFEIENGNAIAKSQNTFHSEKECRKSGTTTTEREPSTASTVSVTSRQFQDCAEFVFRKRLPTTMFSRDDFSIWSILKQCIGKELSKITMPVVFNEPLSFLQRLCEYMEYTYLIQKACTLTDPVERLQTVAAFSVSALASQLGRVGKPYNPLLGETFEYNRPDLGFHWVSEQVSHHPPISAFHVTGTDSEFDFHGSVHPKLKFWGRSVEAEPKGVMTLTLNSLNETYTWSNPHASVHNVVVGKPWIEQHGIVEIANHSTKDKCILNFKAHSWFRNDLNRVEGYIIDAHKNKVRYIEGDWTKHLFSLSPEAHETYKQEMNSQHKSGRDRKGSSSSKTSQFDVLASMEASDDDCIRIWEAEERPSYSRECYSFTSFAITLNELKNGDRNVLPPTDTRLRPDVRCQENGSVDDAGDEKWRLEEKQRAARKLRIKNKEDWEPRWFRHETNPATEAPDWIFDPNYKSRDWTSCPDIF